MNFAPVGIRCPEHASVGAGARPSAKRQMQMAHRRASTLTAPATIALVAINIGVFLITVFQGAGINAPGGKLFESMWLSGVQVANGDWWRLVTAMFLHGSLLHIAFNMFALYWLGTVVEQAIGTARFLLVYIVSGLGGSAGALIISFSGGSLHLTPLFAVTVGASGAIFGIMGALLVLEYMTTGSFAGQAMGLILINLVITFTIANISVGGHLGGLVVGTAATFVLMRTRYVKPVWIGPAIVVAIGMASIAVAYIRVESFL